MNIIIFETWFSYTCFTIKSTYRLYLQIVPYLICMSTDTEVTVSHTADKNLQEIDKKYPGFIHMKAQLGIRLSYQLQKILQGDTIKGIIRGFR